MNEHVALKQPPVADGYEDDFFAWTQVQAEMLEQQRFDALDLDNLIDEIASLGREQVHSVESHIIRIAEHLLKLAVSGNRDPRAVWAATVSEQRRRLARRLKMNPSLRGRVPELLAENWGDIVSGASEGLLRDAERALAALLPPFTVEQLVDPDFFPGN